MKKNILITLFLFIIANALFADEISNIFIDKYTGIDVDESSIKLHRHSAGVNFGSTVFYTLLAPAVFNLLLPNNNNNNLKLQGNFGLDITYTFRVSKKIDINVDAGFYAMKTYYDNSKILYNGSVYGLGLSVGGRFYFNKKDRASGFFLMPKIGTTLFITHGREYQKDPHVYINKNNNIWDFYVSGEMGFRIDMSIGSEANRKVSPFLDISLFDIGFSYKSIIRFVPLPRLAIGILF